jgi:integrase
MLVVGPRSKTFYLHATMHRRTHRVRLGPWPIVSADEARDQCLTTLRRLYRGEPVKTVKPTTAPTLSSVLTEYIAARKLSTKGSADLRSVIGVHAAAWVDKSIDELDARAVAAQYRLIAANSPAPANRLLAALSALTRYSRAANGVGDATLIQRVRALLGGTEDVAARDVVIPDDVQGKWAKAVAGESTQVARYFKALMLTGLRANELRKLPPSGWDATAGALVIATTKNGKPHALPVGIALLALIEEEVEALPPRTEQKGDEAAIESCLFDIPVKVYRAACDRIGVAVGFSWHLHDLRRTFATVATRAGVDAGMVKRLMNHSTSGDVTMKHYVRLNLEDMRPAMQTVETRLLALWAGVA